MEIEFYTCSLCQKQIPLANRTVHLLRCEQMISSIIESPSNNVIAGTILDNSIDNNLLHEDKWICNLCTYHNHIHSENCEVCSNKNSVHQLQDEDNIVGHEILAPNHWQCLSCTFDNAVIEHNCLMCNRPRETVETLSSAPLDDNEAIDLDNNMSSIGTSILLGAGIGASLAWLNNRNIRSGASLGASLGAISGFVFEELLHERERNRLSIADSSSSRRLDIGSSSDDWHQGFTQYLPMNGYIFENQNFQLIDHSSEVTLDHSSASRSLSNDDINSLPVRCFSASSSKHEKESCPICLCEYTTNCRIKSLPCLHYYHPDCIDNWLQQSNSCPICKHIVIGLS